MRLFLLSTLAIGCAKSGAPTAAPVANTPDAGRPTPERGRSLFLWEVRKGDAVSTLMGTCHLSIPLDHSLPPEHRERLTGARVLVNEVDITAAADPVATMPLLWTPEYDLADTIGSDNFHSLAVSVRAVMPAPMLKHMRPWIAAASRMVVPNQAVPLLDGAVASAAAKASVATRPLETMAEQAELLGDFDDLFASELRPPTEAEQAERSAAMQAMAEGCVNADLRDIDGAMSGAGTAQMTQVLRDARNRNWAPIVVEEATAGGMFLAVGAGHMLGSTGMIEMLMREGFEVVQLTTDSPAVPIDMPLLSSDPLQAVAEPDPAEVDAWVEVWSADDGPLTAMCADNQVVPQCFAPEGRTCLDVVREDAGLCAAAFFDELPAEVGGALLPNTARNVFGCSVTGAIMAGLAEERVPETEMCTQIMNQMKAASGRAAGG